MNGQPVVVMASQRTDMPRWYASDLVGILKTKYPPPKVHTLVLATKFPGYLVKEPLRSVIKAYDSVIAQVTVTGLGGTSLERIVPPVKQTIRDIRALTQVLGDPARIFVRIDPLVDLTYSGGRISNLEFLKDIAPRTAEFGVINYVVSFMELALSTRERFRSFGLTPKDLSDQDKASVVASLRRIARNAQVNLQICGYPEAGSKPCLDMGMLVDLHPKKLVPAEAAQERRFDCVCVRSTDIGWYDTHQCRTGCLYCNLEGQRGGGI